MNGPPKDQQANKDGKSGILNQSSGLPDDPSRNALGAGPSGQPGQNLGNVPQGGTAPPTPAPGPNQGMTAPSPSSILSNPGSMNLGGPSSATGPDAMAPGLFSNDFIQSVASSLEGLDAQLFPTDGDLNFERDFGQWFNDDVSGALDMSK
jgi:collagen type III alpha